MTHHYSLRVRSYELDMHRHVNNATYLHYFETARMEFLTDIGFDYSGLLSKGIAFFVSKISVAYKAPALFNDDLVVTTEPVKRKRFSGVFRQTIYRNEEEICSADVTWGCVNRNGRPVQIPKELDLPELWPGDQAISV
jgi:thioesterase III